MWKADSGEFHSGTICFSLPPPQSAKYNPHGVYSLFLKEVKLVSSRLPNQYRRHRQTVRRNFDGGGSLLDVILKTCELQTRMGLANAAGHRVGADLDLARPPSRMRCSNELGASRRRHGYDDISIERLHDLRAECLEGVNFPF